MALLLSQAPLIAAPAEQMLQRQVPGGKGIAQSRTCTPPSRGLTEASGGPQRSVAHSNLGRSSAVYYKVKAGFKGTWCSGITSAPHAEGPGLKSQCVQPLLQLCWEAPFDVCGVGGQA